ncbi:MAG: Dabb family protein [Defluviitaleaceae bacterium]|nr:Dabb family protein [Defluviitaleaceae bacterium]
MVRHIIARNFKDEFTNAENLENAKKIKLMLESLKDKIGGIVEMKVHINLLQTSNRAIVLDSLFVDEDALKAYQIHPEHVKVVEFLQLTTTDKICLDYLEN